MDKGGHYFTVWAPRQAGKTWLIRRAMAEIRARYGDRFLVGVMSMQGVYMDDDEPDAGFLKRVPRLFRRSLGVKVDEPPTWESFQGYFGSEADILTRPVILLIDEFDSLPGTVVDRLVTMFRDIYLDRENHRLHGLALVGVRAVLGVESHRGSPFNVQRSLHVPNLTRAEVGELFEQYSMESGQRVEPEVVDALFDATRGQPGLVSWFGELLTEKYNPGRDQPISPRTWRKAYMRALHVEWNNTILNLVAKARKDPYRAYVVKLFSESDLEFSLDRDWCNYLYLNGVIDYQPDANEPEGRPPVCRFSCPFVQERLYNALADDLFGGGSPVLPIRPGDDLTDVFTETAIHLPPLMDRYRAYLARLREQGIDPWENQPRRQDLNITEATGHFHLYAWLREAIRDYASVSPDFPTGNGKVDLVVQTKEAKAVLEVKSFRTMRQLARGREEAAAYARQLGLEEATLVVFVHTRDESEAAQLCGEVDVDGVRVVTVAIAWG